MAPAPKIPTLKFCWRGLRLPRPWSARKATLPLHMAFRAADPKGELRSAYGLLAPRLHHRRSYVADARERVSSIQAATRPPQRPKAKVCASNRQRGPGSKSSNYGEAWTTARWSKPQHVGGQIELV